MQSQQQQQQQQAQLVNVLDLSKVTQGDGQVVTGQPQIVIPTTPNEGNDGGESTDEGIVLDTSLIQGGEISPGENGDKKGNRHGPNNNPGKNSLFS